MKRIPSCIFALVVLVIVLISCNERGNRFESRLDVLDSLMVQNPDSAYHLLLDMRSEAEEQRARTRIRYNLVLADAQNKAYITFTTDSVMNHVVEYYDNHGSANEKMRAHYLLGCVYRDLKDVPMELQCFHEATEMVDTTRSDCDYYTLVSVYGQMADIYFAQHLPQHELKALSQCEKFAIKSHDMLTATSAYELRLRSFWNMNMKDSVLSVSENARKRYLALGNKRKAARLLGPAISIHLDRGEFAKAKEYMDIVKCESGWFEGNEITTPSASIYYRSLGRYALHENKLDSAKYYFHKLLEHHQYEAAYQGLMSVYEKTGQVDSVMKYSRLYVAANDSTHEARNAMEVAQMTLMYNYGREKRNSEMAKTQLLLEKGKSTMYLVIIFLFVVAMFVLYFINNKRHKDTIDKIKSLNQEIEHKTLLLNEALNNHDDEVELQMLREALGKVKAELLKYKKSDALAAFFDSEIYKWFKKTGIKGDGKITNEEWDTMTRLFNSIFSDYTDFIHTGKSMTEDQVKVCMLIRMGFGETEMANVLGADLKRISRIKVQINQKLFDVSNAKDLVPNLKTVF